MYLDLLPNNSIHYGVSGGGSVKTYSSGHGGVGDDSFDTTLDDTCGQFFFPDSVADAVNNISPPNPVRDTVNCLFQDKKEDLKNDETPFLDISLATAAANLTHSKAQCFKDLQCYSANHACD